MTIDNEFYDGVVGKPDIDELLKHYGVMGMKWGVRKQPETKGGIKKRKKLTNKQKKILKRTAIGAGIVAGTLLAAYGGYKLNNFAKLGVVRSGKEIANQLFRKAENLHETKIRRLVDIVEAEKKTGRMKSDVADNTKKLKGLYDEYNRLWRDSANYNNNWSKDYLNTKNKIRYVSSYVKSLGNKSKASSNFAKGYIRKKYGV